MADYDKSAHDMMRFRAGKYSEFERGRFLVAYHEDRLYSVRDEKRGTVTLVEARDPESAYLKASSIRPISAADVRPVGRGEWIYDGYNSWRCSACNNRNQYAFRYSLETRQDVLQDYFCPRCGANMLGKAGEHCSPIQMEGEK